MVPVSFEQVAREMLAGEFPPAVSEAGKARFASASARLATFLRAIYELAKKEDPDDA
jgi:hypothetical protein